VTSRQKKYALITRFRKKLREKGIDDSMNIYAEQWAANDLVESYTLEGCYDLIDYYFNVSASPNWKWFTYNADKVYNAKKAKEEDDRTRALLRKQAKDWLNK
jgi:hypothetical protein